ncbi:hypothetical protein QFC22_000801 [Naganishia vaughanmartiniae]|uniref:Uncharacterized protein n=1 Tax=Naganishia vaughanmartiniae TaxID=1424756 RepID=A0ACC2XKP4_9TREE|nr:hypothetical protein QFC22_000801 [Naganishia vaughanmartiniae]
MSQYAIRKGVPADVQKIAMIAFEAYRLCDDWAILWTDVRSEDWIDVQMDLVMQHFDSVHDIVLVAEDTKGEIVGFIYGRVLGKGMQGAAQRKPLAGRNMSVVDKISNADFIRSMLDKYGRILLPDKQGGGVGKALLSYVINEARHRGVNIAMAGDATLEAAGLYKKFGFVELTPPRMVEGIATPLVSASSANHTSSA